MALVFDYANADQLNQRGLNPREAWEIKSLLLATGRLPASKDGSHGQVFKYAFTWGKFATHVHLLCPPIMVHSSTNPKLFTTANYFSEWLLVSVKGDIYLIVVDTKRDLATKKSSSEIYEVSKKNPRINWEDQKLSVKQVVRLWLKQCKLEAKPGAATAVPVHTPGTNGGPVQRYPNTSGAPAAPLNNGDEDGLYNITGDEPPYNAMG
jgi:hypothetical protein